MQNHTHYALLSKYSGVLRLEHPNVHTHIYQGIGKAARAMQVSIGVEPVALVVVKEDSSTLGVSDLQCNMDERVIRPIGNNTLSVLLTVGGMIERAEEALKKAALDETIQEIDNQVDAPSSLAQIAVH